MSVETKCSREETIAHWKECLGDCEPHRALLYFLEHNQYEKVEIEKGPARVTRLFDQYEDLFCRTLYLTASEDAKTILADRQHLTFHEAIFSCPTIVFAAAIDEIVLRNYLRHLLLDFFGLCDELDAMEDVLVEMFKHRAGVPIPWTKYDVESWWESFPAGGFLGYFTEEQ